MGCVPHALVIIIIILLFFFFYCCLAAKLKAFKTSFVDWKRKTPTGCRVPVVGGMYWRIDVVFPDLSRFFETGF